jgi:signal transduction histidine kinase
MREYAEKKCCAVDLRPGADLPSVSMNQTEMAQVIVNLVQNAIEAGASRVIVSSTAHQDSVRISVQDDGGGVTEERQRRLFDPFYTTRQGQGGTGLGLSITHGIVRDHGGSIDVVSDPGRDTTFTVALPRAGAGKLTGATHG